MKCRDCGEDKPSIGSVGVRRSLCPDCLGVRVRVVRAIESGAIPMTDFQNYQRNGLRTKRLLKMGYSSLVKPSPEAK